jgi:hypothetical protein
LLEVCQRKSAPVAAPAFGAAGPRRDLERRLVMVMREQVPCRVSWRAVVGLGALALLAVPAWTVGQVAPPPPAGVAEVRAEERRAGATEERPTRAEDTAKAPAKAKAADEKDKRLRELEDKVAGLLKEIQALRKAGSKPTGGTSPGEVYGYLTGTYKALQYPPAVYGPAPAPRAEVVLTRTTYALPAAKAEALGKFLREHVKAAVLEVKVEKDYLIVTTTPEVQRAVGQFILLLQRKHAAASTPAPSPPRPIFRGSERSDSTPPAPSTGPGPALRP